MPPFGLVKRRDIIKYLIKFGFKEPYSGGKHQFMIKDSITLTIPNLHTKEIGKELLVRILRQTGISKKVWGEL